VIGAQITWAALQPDSIDAPGVQGTRREGKCLLKS